MAITLKRQLTPEEKNIILQRHGRICFATGHAIPAEESLHYDHIKAFTLGGQSELDNIAPMCELHNKAKGMLPLEDFRIRLQLLEFFNAGDRLTLKNLLQFLKDRGQIASFGGGCVLTPNNGKVTLDSAHGKFTYDLLVCPTTGWKYFYAILPVELVDSDDDQDHQFGLQPRFLILDKVFNLFRHFQNHPVLQPSIGRFSGGKIVFFDGQHKAAALLWAGRRTFECKIYLDPVVRLLNETNISAHDQFAQLRFFSSVMVLKLGSQFGKDFEDYKNREDHTQKSEAGFLEYLEQMDPTLTRGERNKRFRSYLYNSILEDPDNHLTKLVSAGNRSSNETPLTVDMLSKSIFANFLNTEAVGDNLASPSAYKRDQEIAGNVKLMNLLFELSLCNWNPTATANDHTRIRLERIYSSKSIMAWSEILKAAVCAKMELTDEEDRAMPLYRDLNDNDWEKIKVMVERLLNWTSWSSPANSEIDSQLANNKSVLKNWFKSKGLTTSYLLGASE